MIMQHDNTEVFSPFREVAGQFCAAVDSARGVNRDDLVLKIYRILPLLIGEAISLPVIESSEGGNQTGHKKTRITREQWGELYSLLKEKLGDWNLYSQVFDPTKDKEAISGSLADDIADISRFERGSRPSPFQPCCPERHPLGMAATFLFSLGRSCNECPTLQSTFCWSPP
jgi:Domain of unknown function (DUF5063)